MTTNLDAHPQTDARGTRRIESVVRREAPALLAYFERRCAHHDAPDLLGETLLVAWRRASSPPEDDQEARMWLFGVARRVLANSRRSGIRRQALVDRLRDQVSTRAAGQAPPDHRLQDALATLSPLDAEIIRLLHWDGFSLVEIARHLDRPAGTIRSRYSRARAALRTALQDD